MRVIDRVISAVTGAGCEAVLVANDLVLFSELGLRIRPDLHPGRGPLCGVETALTWADEEGFDAAVIVGCDMPFLESGLLGDLIAHMARGRVVVPESRGPLGIEPLCALYGVSCLPAVEAQLATGNPSMGRLVDTLPSTVIPLEEVARHGPPEQLFFNLNRIDQLATAEEFLS